MLLSAHQQWELAKVWARDRHLAWRGLPHARARERVVPISEPVFGTLTQNWSSLEPLGFAAVAGPPCIVDRVYHTYELLKSQSGTLKDCGAPGCRTMVPPPVRKLDPKILRRMP